MVDGGGGGVHVSFWRELGVGENISDPQFSHFAAPPSCD